MLPSLHVGVRTEDSLRKGRALGRKVSCDADPLDEVVYFFHHAHHPAPDQMSDHCCCE